MANTKDFFDRIVRLTFIESPSGGKVSVDTDNPAKQVVQIVFNPKEDRDLCSRIDFWVMSRGVNSGGSSFFKTARIDIYNLGQELNSILDTYGRTETAGAWNIKKKRIQVVLEVGHKDSGYVCIFLGQIGSFNAERIQTETSVDVVWHLFCQSAFTGDQSNSETRATSGTDYTSYAIKEASTGKITGQQAIKDAIMREPRSVISLEKEGMKKSGFFSFLSTGSGEEQVIPTAKTVIVNEQNINDYFDIEYVMADNPTIPDPLLEQSWRDVKNYTPCPVSSDLTEAVTTIAKRWGGCEAMIDYRGAYNEITVIRIWRTGLYDTVRAGGKNWKIHNFENLLESPKASASGMDFTLFMEPSMEPQQSIELTVDPGFKPTSSFVMNFSATEASARPMFAGTNIFGVASSITEANKMDYLGKQGNIFGKRYQIIFLEHQGSTHEKVWKTIATCKGIVGK